MVNDSSYAPPFAYICINLNLDLFQHYSIYSTKVIQEIQNAFFNKYSLSIDHTCYLIPVIEYMPIISTVMGHQRTETTSIYISVDYDKLKQCALPMPVLHSPFYSKEGSHGKI